MREPIAQRLIPLTGEQIGRVVVSVFPPMRRTGGKAYCRYRVAPGEARGEHGLGHRHLEGTVTCPSNR